jgi:hypothetical protein
LAAAAESFWELLDELWAPELAALLPAAELVCVSSACVVICIAERAARDTALAITFLAFLRY